MQRYLQNVTSNIGVVADECKLVGQSDTSH